MSAQNDYFLNKLSNEGFSPVDFQKVGLNPSNTSIESKDTYKKLEAIQNNERFQTNGQFDESKFNSFYNQALKEYNLFTVPQACKDMASSIKFFRTDIWADPQQRTQGPEFMITKMANPLRQSNMIRGLGIVENPTYSAREIAEMNKTYDPITNSWIDSPNDIGFFGNLWNPKVLAQYEEDEDTIDPFTGKINHHTKGEYKLNSQGQYYYENLGNKPVYGKQVLSAWDTLTVDGSWANKNLDFFDSDDIEKSMTGSLAKAAIKIIPAFIPGIAPWYIGTRVLLQASDILAKIGKMATSSDNETLSRIESMYSALSTSSSDYSTGFNDVGNLGNLGYNQEAHAWSMENMINLGADVFTQLAEQRWIFTKAPELFAPSKVKKYGKTGKIIEGESQLTENQSKFLEETIEKYSKPRIEQLENRMTSAGQTALTEKGIENLITARKEIALAAQSYANSELKKYIKDYQNWGKYLSRIYMTTMVTTESYSELVEAGADKWQAALFVLGYSALEYGILSMGIGEMMLPELRLDKASWKIIANKLGNIVKQGEQSGKSNQSIIKDIFNFSKSIFKGDYATPSALGLTFRNATANALGEGVEEVSEEILYDISKGLYNAASYLMNSDSKLESNWRDKEGNWTFSKALNDYALNFVGGFIGGGLGQALPEFRAAMKMKKNFDSGNIESDRSAAWQELISIVREGKAEDFKKVYRKMNLGNQYLSATEVDEYGNYQQGTTNNNQDKVIKQNFDLMIDNIEQVLKSEGANISDQSFLTTQTAKDLRFRALQQSAFGSMFLQDFNIALEDLVKTKLDIKQINESLGDSPTDQQRQEAEDLIKIKEQHLKDVRKVIESYKKGERSAEFRDKLLFEMSPQVTKNYFESDVISYIEAKTKQRIDQLPKNIVEFYTKEYNELKNSSNFKDKLEMAYTVFKRHGIIFKDIIDTIDAVDNFNTSVSLFNSTLKEKISGNNENEIIGFETGLLEHDSRYSEILKALLPYFDDSTTERAFRLLSLNKDSNSVELSNLGLNSLKERGRAIRNELVDLLVDGKNRQEFIKVLRNLPYIDFEIKNTLNNIIGNVVAELRNIDLIEAINFNNEVNQIIDNAESSPILQILDQFAPQVDPSVNSISSILDLFTTQLSNLSKEGDISQFGMQNSQRELLNRALTIINLAESQIIAANTDDVNQNNLVGFNYTSNELAGKDVFATIDKNTANFLYQELQKIKSQILYFSKIAASNTGKKAAEQPKIHARMIHLYFRKIKQIISVLDKDEFEDGSVDEFLQTLNSLDILQGFEADPEYNLSEQQQVALETQRIKLKQAVYNFFRKGENLNKLDIFIQNNLDLYNPNDILIDGTSSNLNDFAFLMEIATDVALNVNEFYNNYKEVIADDIAPFPGQESQIRSSLAFLLDKDGIFDKFYQAVNKFVVDNLATSTTLQTYVNANLVLIDDTAPLDSSVAIQFFRTWLNEGIAGSGKTNANDVVIQRYLKQFHPELVKKQWIVHNTVEQAKELAESMGLSEDEYEALDIATYLSRIAPDWTPNHTGNIDINLYEQDANKIYHYKNVKIASDLDSPSLVIIDEMSGLSQQDMLLHDEFLSKYDIKSIISGDYNQSGVVSVIENPTAPTLYLRTYRNNFGHVGKLGSSIRTDNVYKDNNSAQILASHDEIATQQNATDATNVIERNSIKFTYAEVAGQGLYGDEIVENDRANWESPILLMLETLKPGEKLHYMYQEAGSDVYNFLEQLKQQPEYADKIDFQQASRAQGSEGQYYVVDLNTPDTNNEQFIRDLYTGITRSKQGSLILQYNDSRIGQLLDQQTPTTVIPPSLNLTPEQIANYANRRKEILNTEGVLSMPTSSTTTETNETIKSDNDPDIDDGELKNQINEDNNKKHIITNDDDDKLNLFVHTFITQETALEKNSAGYYIVDPNQIDRVDGVYGLLKSSLGWTVGSDGRLMEGSHKLSNQEIEEKIHQIRSLFQYCTSKSEMLNLLQRFNIIDDASKYRIDFAYKACKPRTNIPSDKKEIRFFKSLKEKLYGIFKTSTSVDFNNSNGHRKNIVALISKLETDSTGTKAQVSLEVPIMTLTSPLSLLSNPDFKDIQTIYNGTPGTEIPKKLQATLNHRNFKSCKNSKYFEKLALLFLNEHDNIVYLQDDFVPANKFQVTGPIVTANIKGSSSTYFRAGYEYDGTWFNVEELVEKFPGRKFSERIYTLNEDLNDGSNTLIEKGKPFILVADHKIGLLSDSDMIDEFLSYKDDNTKIKRISVIYVSPPKVSIEDYLKNINLLYKKNSDEEVDKNIGNMLTSYRLFNYLIHSNYPEIKQFIDELCDKDVKLKEKLDKIKAELPNSNLSPKQIIELLNKNSSLGGTLKSKVQQYLRILMLRSYDTDDATKVIYPESSVDVFAPEIQYRIELLKKILKDTPDGKHIDGIFYHISQSPTGQYQGFIPMNLGEYEENHKFKGASFQVNGKINSTGYIGDFSSLIDEIINVIGTNPKSKPRDAHIHTGWYNGNRTITSTPDPHKAEVIQMENYINSLKIPTGLKGKIKSTFNKTKLNSFVDFDTFKSEFLTELQSNNALLVKDTHILYFNPSDVALVEQIVYRDPLNSDLLFFRGTNGHNYYFYESELNEDELQIYEDYPITTRSTPALTNAELDIIKGMLSAVGIDLESGYVFEDLNQTDIHNIFGTSDIDGIKDIISSYIGNTHIDLFERYFESLDNNPINNTATCKFKIKLK